MVKAVSESARERETLRYEAASIAATSLFDPAPSPFPSSSPSSSSRTADSAYTPDPILTAVAQLAVLRLSASRAYVSFFDKKYQYILAEATQSSSIRHNQPDHGECHLRGKALPRSDTICENVLLQTNDQEDEASPQGSDAALPISIFSDLAAESRFSCANNVLAQPDLRFYAGIPIRSPRGVNIGVFAVLDMEPRTELQPEILHFLRDMSSTVTSHLEMKQTHASLKRNERMVRGLGSFVEGAGSMSFKEDVSNMTSFQDSGAEGSLNVHQQNLQDQQQGQGQERPPASGLSALPLGASESPSSSEEGPRSPGSPRPPRSRDAGQAPGVSLSASSMVTFTAENSEDEHLSSIKSMFSRAANIIRESIEVEGVVFLDASIASFGGLVTNDTSTSSSSHSNPSYSSSSEESLIDQRDSGQDKTCNILGFSTSSASSVDCDAATSYQGKVPEKFLKTLLRRYPQGKIFNFDEEGCMSSGESSEEDVLKPSAPADSKASDESPGHEDLKSRVRLARPWSRRNEGISIIKILPGARSVMVIPLWDSNKERWFAGGLIWTCTPFRVFTKEGELSYLRAFGTTM
ncbi:Uu.00g131930.m01.CDS01 [Anthostomella pinea]|uniref:Uu.00g131930.m01.CDS01 n=1 Tax=Anthostomella pinea TaxID=933095 RepID=A0AAI8VK36_9PEZI|nr:Uu.00g131930.m01.CDS01 [Anthostomella pinea]